MSVRLLVLSLALAAPALAVTSRITITGYEVVADPAIAGAVAPLKAGMMKNVGKLLSRDVQLADVKRFQDLGCVANVKTGTRPYKDGVKLCYRIEANPKIRSIAIEGLESLDAGELLAEFGCQPGQVLDYTRLYADLNKIPQLVLDRKGVMYVDVLDQRDVQVDEGRIVIHVREFAMGELVIRGVAGAEAELVRRAFKPKRGRAILRAELLASLCDIYQLSTVKDVGWRPKFDREAGRVNIVLDVTPKNQQHARAGDAGEAE